MRDVEVSGALVCHCPYQGVLEFIPMKVLNACCSCVFDLCATTTPTCGTAISFCLAHCHKAVVNPINLIVSQNFSESEFDSLFAFTHLSPSQRRLHGLNAVDRHDIEHLQRQLSQVRCFYSVKDRLFGISK